MQTKLPKSFVTSLTLGISFINNLWRTGRSGASWCIFHPLFFSNLFNKATHKHKTFRFISTSPFSTAFDFGVVMNDECFDDQFQFTQLHYYFIGLEIIMIANTLFILCINLHHFKTVYSFKNEYECCRKTYISEHFVFCLMSSNNEGIMDLVFTLISMFKFWTLINLIWLVSLHLGFSAMHKTSGCHIWYIYILVFTGHILQIVFTDETAMYNYLSLSYLQTNAWHHRIAVNPGPFFSWMIAVYSLFIYNATKHKAKWCNIMMNA